MRFEPFKLHRPTTAVGVALAIARGTRVHVLVTFMKTA